VRDLYFEFEVVRFDFDLQLILLRFPVPGSDREDQRRQFTVLNKSSKYQIS